MMSTVTAREIQRNYRRIFDQVQLTHRPIIVITNNRPQVAIVSLETLATVTPPALNSAQTLHAVLRTVHDGLKAVPLPADLSAKHNEYLWEERDDD